MLRASGFAEEPRRSVMPRRAPIVVLSPADRAELDRRVRARTGAQQDAVRARIVLLAADGLDTTAIAATLGIARGTARSWRARFAAQGLSGLADRPHRPPPRKYAPDVQARIVVLACQAPADLGWDGQSHWTIKDLARYIGDHPELGLGTPRKSTIHLILQAHDVRLDRL
jgi:putative transposase